jgi:uncharacterized membrane protein YfcA
MDMTVELLALLFLVALVAGFVDSICGGGGLIALPVLMLVGLPPAQALGTNKLQGMFGKMSAVKYFWQQGMIDISAKKWWILISFIGAGLGAIVVQQVDGQILQQYIPWFAGVIALYLILSPHLGEVTRQQRVKFGLSSVLVIAVLGFYDGFFGPASGSFIAIAFVALFGFNLVQATVQTKVLLLVANMAALAMFISGDSVIWTIGLTMAVGQWIGARYGSQLVCVNGSKIIKPMLVSVCGLLVLKTVWLN